MSDTPETDAHQRVVLGGVGGDWKVVLADFARNLERQRNEARAEAARLQMELDTSCNAEELRQVREENARLREALDTLTLVIGLTPIAGNKEALQEAFDNARKLLTP